MSRSLIKLGWLLSSNVLTTFLKHVTNSTNNCWPATNSSIIIIILLFLKLTPSLHRWYTFHEKRSYLTHMKYNFCVVWFPYGISYCFRNLEAAKHLLVITINQDRKIVAIFGLDAMPSRSTQSGLNTWSWNLMSFFSVLPPKDDKNVYHFMFLIKFENTAVSLSFFLLCRSSNTYNNQIETADSPLRTTVFLSVIQSPNKRRRYY